MANSFEREYGGCHAQLDGGRTPVYERLEYSNLKDWNFQVFSLELNAPSQNLSRGRQNRRRPPNSRVRGRGDLGAARCSPAACGQRPCAPAAQQQQSGPAPFAQATKAPPHRSTPRPAHHAPPPPLLSPVDTGSDGKTATRMKRLGRWPAANSGDWRSRPSLGTAQLRRSGGGSAPLPELNLLSGRAGASARLGRRSAGALLPPPPADWPRAGRAHSRRRSRAVRTASNSPRSPAVICAAVSPAVIAT